MTASEQLARADSRLTEFVDAILAGAAKRAGAALACRVGCTECCIGPFPINALDALRLRRGFERLRSRDPRRAARLRERARRAAAALAPDFPGDSATGLLADDERARDAFFRRHEALACPALDPETGACELHEYRPISCRTFGPPVRVEGLPLPPCRLCFRGASARRIEACRVEVDCAALEEPMLPRAESVAALPGETIIVFALGGHSVDRRLTVCQTAAPSSGIT